jgi:hypothetical protein
VFNHLLILVGAKNQSLKIFLHGLHCFSEEAQLMNFLLCYLL